MTPFLLLVVFRFRPMVHSLRLSKILNISNSTQRIQNRFSDMGDAPDEVFFFLSMYDPYHLWQHCFGRSIISLHRLVKVNKKPYDTWFETNTFNEVFPVSPNVVSLIAAISRSWLRPSVDCTKIFVCNSFTNVCRMLSGAHRGSFGIMKYSHPS